jgi:ribosomal protein S18 acetylase RimI-like enzyme
MDVTCETVPYQCRFLDDGYFDRLYAAFIEAFSDYVIPFALTETQFRNHINLNAVDLERTIGSFEGDRLIGFSLNGFGDWNGRSTVYDAGTGVIPAFRRRGVSEKMFEMMVPHFKGAHFEQWLLEVISTNTAAIRLYEKLGFHRTREIALLQFDGKVAGEKPSGVEIRDIDEPDWKFLTAFWDGTTTWQNSVDAMERSRMNKRILGAFVDGECVGYIVSS